MGKSNYWTIWCPISQFVEHFDFLAHIYILLLQNKVRDNKSLNAGIQETRAIFWQMTNMEYLQWVLQFYKMLVIEY